jgi:MFS family permease
MYFFNYVDRGALAQARLNNLERDLHMAGTDFNTAVSILTVGYVLMQIPSNMFLTRVRPSVYLSVCMIIWSVIVGTHVSPQEMTMGFFRMRALNPRAACTGAVKSYGSLLACRFLLGFFEAPVRKTHSS